MLKETKVKDSLKTKNKKAVSLMVSYVLLISIVIVVSMLLYAWIQGIIPGVGEINDCKSGTNIILQSTECQGTQIQLVLKNNGRFSIDGVRVIVSNDTSKGVQYLLIPDLAGGLAGNYHFTNQLDPGNSTSVTFKLMYRDIKDNQPKTLNQVERINIQPYIIPKEKIVYCSESSITQIIDTCENLGTPS